MRWLAELDEGVRAPGRAGDAITDFIRRLEGSMKNVAGVLLRRAEPSEAARKAFLDATKMKKAEWPPEDGYDARLKSLGLGVLFYVVHSLLGENENRVLQPLTTVLSNLRNAIPHDQRPLGVPERPDTRLLALKIAWIARPLLYELNTAVEKLDVEPSVWVDVDKQPTQRLPVTAESE
jgi:hypothetical protein